MNPTLHALLVVGGLILSIVAFIAIVAYFGDRLVKKSVRKRIEKLRSAGTIPSAAEAGDADVIRLANAGKREAAALLYVSLHNIDLGKARVVVGSPATSTRLIYIVVALLLCAGLLTATRNGGNPGVIVIWVANLFILSAAWLKVHGMIARNRKILEGGNLPSSGGDAWGKRL